MCAHFSNSRGAFKMLLQSAFTLLIPLVLAVENDQAEAAEVAPEFTLYGPLSQEENPGSSPVSSPVSLLKSGAISCSNENVPNGSSTVEVIQFRAVP
jgi:hypothetical protein